MELAKSFWKKRYFL